MQDSPLFERHRDGTWMPYPVARGPFDGMQGGAVAALMCAAIEEQAGGRLVASVTTHFVRPIPLAPLQVDVGWLHWGRRVRIADAVLHAGTQVLAVQRATVIEGRSAPLPVPPPRAADPASGALQKRGAPHGQPWLMDTMEMRLTDDGVVWFRMRRPVTESPSTVAPILLPADWAHGLAAPQGAEARPAAAIPNPDLTVHTFRPAEGEWIGLDPATAWSTLSIGVGWAALLDTRGLIGRVAMSVAVSPLPEITP